MALRMVVDEARAVELANKFGALCEVAMGWQGVEDACQVTLFAGRTLNQNSHSLGFSDDERYEWYVSYLSLDNQVREYAYAWNWGSCDKAIVTLDATVEVIALARQYLAGEKALYIRREYASRSGMVAGGREVRMVKKLQKRGGGLLYPEGLRGWVVEVVDGAYGTCLTMDFGPDFDGGRRQFYMPIGKFQVVNPGQYVPSTEAVFEEAISEAACYYRDIERAAQKAA